MLIEKDVHIIPFNDSYVLYVQRRGTAVVINRDTAYLLKQIIMGKADIESLKSYPAVQQQLIKFGVIIKASSSIAEPSKDFQLNNRLTLFPTHNCNLRCIYCYASAGEYKTILPLKIAKAGIDFGVNSALESGKKYFHLGFHGGGEPFYGPSKRILQESVAYSQLLCRNAKLRLRIHSSTNGILTENTLAWLKDNKIHLQISLDGPEDIQNYNRPFKDGKPSFGRVMKTISYLEKHSMPYHIRATVTAKSVRRMREALTFFLNISSNKSFHFEPLFECGRCKTTGIHEPQPAVFVREFLLLQQKARESHRHVTCSASDLKVRNHFCGALHGNLCITPEGYLTSCFEVNRPDDERAKYFFFGKYDPTAKLKFSFDREKQSTLFMRHVDNIPFCQTCIAKFNCAGDCPAKQSNLFDTSKNKSRCYIHKKLTEENIKVKILRSQQNTQAFKKKEGFYAIEGF
jgi:uncharacterized protein